MISTALLQVSPANTSGVMSSVTSTWRNIAAAVHQQAGVILHASSGGGKPRITLLYLLYRGYFQFHEWHPSSRACRPAQQVYGECSGLPCRSWQEHWDNPSAHRWICGGDVRRVLRTLTSPRSSGEAVRVMHSHRGASPGHSDSTGGCVPPMCSHRCGGYFTHLYALLNLTALRAAGQSDAGGFLHPQHRLCRRLRAG